MAPLPHNKVNFGRRRLREKTEDEELSGRLFKSKNAVNDECGLPAFEVPRPFFAQGYISVCGDALLHTHTYLIKAFHQRPFYIADVRESLPF
jgi:L-asparaginase II